MDLQEKIKEIANCSDNFMEIWSKDREGRYHAYDDCRTVFLKNYDKNIRNEDEVALYLFYYLASWGMLRGSGWLMQKDYHIFIPIVRLLYDADEKLLNYDPAEGKLTRDEYAKKILELGKNIDDEFKKLHYYKYNKATKEDEEKTVCDSTDRLTLISKILMGTLGCTPAVDNFDKDTLKELSGWKTIGFSEKVFKFLWDLANTQAVHEKKADIEAEYPDVKYPIFKVLDMILWEYGKRLGKTEEA